MKKILIFIFLLIPSILYASSTGSIQSRDTSARGQITILTEHNKIHVGNSYEVTETNTLASAATRDYRITTPNTTTRIHFSFVVTASLDTTIYIGETANVSGGTGITPLNKERNSGNSSVLTVAHTPTVTNTGTQIFTIRITTGQTNGGVLDSRHEYILKQNTTYLFRITSNAANNNVSTLFDYYEVIP